MVVLGGDPQIPPARLSRARPSASATSASARPTRGARTGTRCAAPPFLVEPDPDWPENVRVDLRDRRWQEILLDEEIPRLLGQGFDGLMLDTIDTAPYLEAKDRGALRRLAPGAARSAARASASASRARRWWPTGRARWPTPRPSSTASSSRGCSRPTTSGGASTARRPTAERDWKLARIARGRRRWRRRPVFTIEYADVGDVALGHWAAERGQAARVSSPTSGSGISTPCPETGTPARSGFPCMFQLFLNI